MIKSKTVPWVLKHTHRLLKLGLSHGLDPEPSPVLLLVLLAQLLQVVNVSVSGFENNRSKLF